MNRRHLALFFAGLIAVTGVAVAATTLTAETRGTVPVGTTGGPLAGVTADRTDLTNVAINQSAAQINTSAGSLVIDGTDDAYARIDRFEGAWTNISNVNTNGGQIRISPGDKQLAAVAGGTDTLSWRPQSATALDDGQVDFVYSASGSNGSVSLGGLAADTEVAAISDDTEVPKILDTATTDANGRVTFDDLPTQSHEIRIRKEPGTLYIRNESAPSNLVKNANIEIRFYLGDDTTQADQIVTRSTSDGTVNMTGLPANESFVVVADANGYLPRRIYVSNLYRQEDIYLLNTSQPHVEKIYQLTDYTGLFPSTDSVLKIQRAINGSWETVQGDFMGASSEFEAQLSRNTRHRLVLINVVTGNRRVLGRVTPLTSGAQEIEVNSRDDISLSRMGPLTAVKPRVRALPATETNVKLSVRSLDAEVTSWNYTTYLVNGSQKTTLDQAQFSSPGSATSSFNLTGEAKNTVEVELGWQTADGRSNVRVVEYQINRNYDNRFSLLAGLTRVGSSLPGSDGQALTTMLSLLFTVFGAAAVATKFRASTEGVGLTAVGILAVFSVIGWIGYAIVFSAGVAWVGLVAVRGGL